VHFIEEEFPQIKAHYHPDWRTVTGHVESLQWRANRGREIQEWLSRHPEVTSYAIVDDDGEDIRPIHEGNFVQTTWLKGIQADHTEQLIKLLLW
jgi:hypothetical protein